MIPLAPDPLPPGEGESYVATYRIGVRLGLPTAGLAAAMLVGVSGIDAASAARDVG